MESVEYKGYTIKIEQDDCDIDPRAEWDNFGVMYCEHRRYNLGDPKAAAPWLNDWRVTKNGRLTYDNETCFDWIEKDGGVMLPLYLYDHGGITMRTRAFNDPWDSGQVGVIYATRAMIQKEFSVKRVSRATRAKAIAILESEVKVYDQYLTGDVWMYAIENHNGDNIDSCGGMFGFDYCEQAAREVVDSLPVQPEDMDDSEVGESAVELAFA